MMLLLATLLATTPLHAAPVQRVTWADRAVRMDVRYRLGTNRDGNTSIAAAVHASAMALADEDNAALEVSKRNDLQRCLAMVARVRAGRLRVFSARTQWQYGCQTQGKMMRLIKATPAAFPSTANSNHNTHTCGVPIFRQPVTVRVAGKLYRVIVPEQSAFPVMKSELVAIPLYGGKVVWTPEWQRVLRYLGTASTPALASACDAAGAAASHLMALFRVIGSPAEGAAVQVLLSPRALATPETCVSCRIVHFFIFVH